MRTYTIKEAMEVLRIAPGNRAQMGKYLKKHPEWVVDRVAMKEGSHVWRLTLDAEAIDAYASVKRNVTRDGRTAYEIRMLPEERDAFLKNANQMNPVTKEAMEALATVIRTLSEAVDMTEYRRRHHRRSTSAAFRI